MLSRFSNVQTVSPRFSNPVVLLPKIPKSPIHSRQSFLFHCFLKPPTMPPPAPSSSTKILAEYAKSNRSSCKKCSNTIAVRALRLGLVSRDARGFDVTKWHHLGCFSFGPYSVASAAEAIKGFDSLKVWENWAVGFLWRFYIVWLVRELQGQKIFLQLRFSSVPWVPPYSVSYFSV